MFHPARNWLGPTESKVLSLNSWRTRPDSKHWKHMPVFSSYDPIFKFPFLYMHTKQKLLTCFAEGARRNSYIQAKLSQKDAGTMSTWSILLPWKNCILLYMQENNCSSHLTFHVHLFSTQQQLCPTLVGIMQDKHCTHFEHSECFWLL